jgi:hypothetical protein
MDAERAKERIYAPVGKIAGDVNSDIRVGGSAEPPPSVRKFCRQFCQQFVRMSEIRSACGIVEP